MRLALAVVVALASLAGGCASIHSYDAPRDINPARTLSLSSSVGTTFDKRDRNGDELVEDKGPDRFKQEKVLVPDAKLNIRIKLNPVLALALDPLPPAAGVGLVGRWVPENDWAPTLTIAPVVNYMVFPYQECWSAEVPAALSRRIGNHWVIYAGPKYLHQSNVLQQESGFVQKLLLHQVPKRPDQELDFIGVFGGIGFGWLHLQVSPEVIYYKSLNDDGEEIIQVGSQIRIAL